MKKLFLGLLFPVVLGACTLSENNAPLIELKDTSWSMNLGSESKCEIVPYIEFSEKNVSGDLGCNSFRADYELKGNRLLFRNAASTMKLCAPDSMELEKKMQRILTDTKSIRQGKDTLTFLDAKGNEILTLIPESMGACR